MEIERSDLTLKVIVTEKGRVSEIVEVFDADMRSRAGTKHVWNTDRSRLLLTIRSKGTKRR